MSVFGSVRKCIEVREGGRGGWGGEESERVCVRERERVRM